MGELETSIEHFDKLVDWMRRRGVGTLVDGTLQIHLMSPVEPNHEAAKPAKEETPEARRQRLILEKYGPSPRKDK